MEALLHDIAHHVALAIEAIAIAIIAIGALEAVIGIVRVVARAGATQRSARRLARVRALAGGGSHVPARGGRRQQSFDPSWDELGRFAAIAAIRTFLSFFLDREVADTRKLQRVRESA